MREAGMSAYELMLSESQERMLMVLKEGREDVARAIFEKWELDFAVIGRTTDSGRMVLKMGGEVVADLPIDPLALASPEYDRPWTKAPEPIPIATILSGDGISPIDMLRRLLANPDLASKRWIWEQYDHMVILMLSESQERMLMVLKEGREDVARAIFEKWELDFAVIGRTTDSGRMVLKMGGEVVADLPIDPLALASPEYDRPWTKAPEPIPIATILPGDEVSPIDMLRRLLAHPDLASKRWIWEQYDHMVMADTAERPGGDAAVVRVHGTQKALAITTDCTPRYCAVCSRW